jgi:hypothetical protein
MEIIVNSIESVKSIYQTTGEGYGNYHKDCPASKAVGIHELIQPVFLTQICTAIVLRIAQEQTNEIN